jgi:hypothetical protein
MRRIDGQVGNTPPIQHSIHISMFQNYYRRRGQLQGHFGAIYSLVATDDGKLLASGGEHRHIIN